ncbi:MAG: hypothetical protein ACOX0E_10795 [Syntrophomonadaceae bacterium]
MHVVNPEAIGVFGLLVTVWCFGAEQLGLGVRGGDHQKIGRSLAYIAILFGGCTQLFTALSMYLFNVTGNSEMSIYLGTIFATFGLFWILVGWFFLQGGDKKQIAHFFLGIAFMTSLFLYKAILIGAIFPLGVVLALIVALTVLLPFNWYGVAPGLAKVCGAINILIGLCSLPLLLKALGL